MVALPEQSPGQTKLEDFIDVESEEVDPTTAPTVSDSEADGGTPGPVQRQVLVLPGQYAVNEEVLDTQGGQYAEIGFGTPVFGGQLYFTRAQCIQIGSDLLQIAGKMTPPKVIKAQAEAASRLTVVEDNKTLVGLDGSPLTTADMRV